MKLKKVIGRSVKDSRGEKTIQVIVKTSKGSFITSAPNGESTGEHAVQIYFKSLEGDIRAINKLDVEKINKIITSTCPNLTSININNSFKILKDVERLVSNKLGGNSLFALEASLLKALSKEKDKELWKLLGGRGRNICSVGNAVGGGLHSMGIKGKKPDFQEFLFIGGGKTFKDCVKVNKIAYNLVGKILKARRRNDEGAWETSLGSEGVLMVMSNVKEMLKKKGFKVDIGLDVAASSFFNKKYNYKNPARKVGGNEQVEYIKNLINEFGIYYVEDPLDENDFKGFGKLCRNKSTKGRKMLIVGDDLTVTNPVRLKKAIKNKSVNAIIVKPNQIGSLIKVKEVIEICKKYGIKTIISHRSGETLDSTIADLGVGFGCDFIKTGIYGKVRESKLRRLVGIEKKLRK